MLPICDHNSPFVHHAKIYIKAFILTVKFEPYIPNKFSPYLNLIVAKYVVPWIPEPSTVNNKLKRREGSGSTGTFFD
jgi:hypothetical protein